MGGQTNSSWFNKCGRKFCHLHAFIQLKLVRVLNSYCIADMTDFITLVKFFPLIIITVLQRKLGLVKFNPTKICQLYGKLGLTASAPGW